MLDLEGGKQSLLGFLILSRAWFGIIFIPLSFVSPLLLYACYNCYDNISIHLIHILNYNDHCLLCYILSIASLSLYPYISSYSARSDVHRVSGRHCVSVVLIHCLTADTPYILGHMVDRESDTPVKSFVVHSLNIGASRVRLRRKNKLCS
jgi:hypothetical protein